MFYTEIETGAGPCINRRNLSGKRITFKTLLRNFNAVLVESIGQEILDKIIYFGVRNFFRVPQEGFGYVLSVDIEIDLNLNVLTSMRTMESSLSGSIFSEGANLSPSMMR